MPISWHQAVPSIMEQIQIENPKSVLDIGIGFGKYGILMRERLEIPFGRYSKKEWKVKIDGIEVFKKYHNPIHDYVYNKVYYKNILDVIDNLPMYDVILLIDVLEHFTKEDGLVLISKMLTHVNKTIIVATPSYPYPQEEIMGNTFETHRSSWTIPDLVDFDFSYTRLPIGAHIFKIRPPTAVVNNKLEDIKDVKYNKDNALTIGYILPHKNLTGGMKMLLEQMKHLRKKGNKIYAIMKCIEGEKVIPEWMNLEVDKEIIIPHDKSYVDYTDDCDILISGWISQLPELEKSNIPVLYWEQGNEWLFGDIPNINMVQSVRKHLEQCYTSAHTIVSASPYIAKTIKARYGRDTDIITNGIDTEFYHAGEKQNNNTILLVGNPYLGFKGFDDAFKSLQKVWDAGYKFNVEWICQVQPNIGEFSFPIKYIVKPDQDVLAQHYRGADIFLFTSWYEGFGMPPLEAMSSGVPVVCTKSGGVDAYISDGVNALMADPGDVNKIAANLIYLMKNEQLKKYFALKGREKALEFSSVKVTDELNDYLHKLVVYKIDSKKEEQINI